MRSLFPAIALVCAATGARADFIDLYANKLDMPLNKGPRTGRSKVLVIPVQIDAQGYQPVDMARLHDFFETGDSGGLTFSRYFEIASSGRYQPVATVAPLVEYKTCPPMIRTANCTIPRGDVSALSQGMDFVRDVFRRAHEEGGVNFAAYDVNGLRGEPDGVIDGAMIVVNVPGVGIALPIEYVNGGSNLIGGNGGPLVLDGVSIPYCAVGGASFVQGKQRLEYVILHEFGHTLGLADLYYEHPSAGDRWPAWGGLHLSLMGDYNYSENVVLRPGAVHPQRTIGGELRAPLAVDSRRRIAAPGAAPGGQRVQQLRHPPDPGL
jgi:M6 family metalloprotease-like protein